MKGISGFVKAGLSVGRDSWMDRWLDRREPTGVWLVRRRWMDGRWKGLGG